MGESKHTPAQRVQRYLDMRAAKPMQQLGDDIHAVNVGTEWEGELLLSDLIAVKRDYGQMLGALKEAEPYLEAFHSLLGRSDTRRTVMQLIRKVRAALTKAEASP